MSLDMLIIDMTLKQKKGIHFIAASIFIWIAVLIIHYTNMPILAKNLYTFCCTAPLIPLAFIISKILHIDFRNSGNPLTKLGLILSINQMLYLLIAMWIYPTVPDKMLMVIGIIFGAHLLPFFWLYKSVSYAVFSVVITITSLLLGIMSNTVVLAISMVGLEVLFCVSLMVENVAFAKKHSASEGIE